MKNSPVTKKTATLGISLILLSGLFGAWYLLKTGNEKAQEREEQANAGEEIINVPEEEVAAVSFKIAGETCFFIRENDMWKLEGDEHFSGDEEAFRTLLGRFAPLRANRTLDSIEDISEYGLDNPVNTFTLTENDGSETVLLIGNNNEGTGDDYALKKEDESTVYTISTSLRDTIGENLTDYASGETLPSFSADAVVQVEVQQESGAYKLTKEDDEWILEDFAEGLDQEAVEDVISELGYIRYSDYVSYYCEEPSQYGLTCGKRITIMYEDDSGDDTEQMTEDGVVEHITEGGAAEHMTENDEAEKPGNEKAGSETGIAFVSLLIGDQDENGNYYVQQEGSCEVHTLSETLINTFLDLDEQDLKETETEAVSEAQTEGEEE